MKTYTFRPIIKKYLWGEEHWYLSTLKNDLSMTMTEDEEPACRSLTEVFGGPFPLLFKIIDAKKTLSVQVHPSDTDSPGKGKEEAWIILATEKDAKIYCGLKEGTRAEDLAEASTIDKHLNVFYPKVGDIFHIRPGIVHAIGGGLKIAEIQQSSDVTYRLFDWNRLDEKGHSRPLHIKEAMAVINYDLHANSPAEICRQGQLESDFFTINVDVHMQRQHIIIKNSKNNKNGKNLKKWQIRCDADGDSGEVKEQIRFITE